MKRFASKISIAAALFGASVMSGSAFALKPGCEAPPCGGGGGNEPPIPTEASNNLSYPVIWSDNVLKPDFVPSTAPWTFAEITGPLTQCVQESPPVNTVPTDIACYYGRKNLGIDEATGDRVFEPPTKIWWLQQRQSLGNTWQAFNITDADAEGGVSTTPVVITGVDTGDLLESSTSIKAKQIRTEFTLLKRVQGSALGNATDSDYTAYLAYNGGTCVLEDNSTLAPNNCFAAHNMSGAVPGTDQSINEIQGTDYGDVNQGGLLDPQAVKVVTNYFSPTVPEIVAVDPPIGMDATVYSSCARLLIQKITGPVTDIQWDSATHSWMPRSAINAPVVDLRAWDGSYSAEINAGGSLIYGYNWNTKNFAEGSGTYRLTFELEGNTADGGLCTNTLNTVFDGTSLSVNVGERKPATLVSQSDLGGTAGEGGAVYVDVDIVVGGGGGGKPNRP